jgi:3-oxoacyl-[acyl-carrier-protein] synthase-3
VANSTQLPILKSRIIGTGLGIPSRVLTNKDLEKLVETSDDWISSRTGIKERRVIQSETESNSSISISAAKEALERSSTKASEIDLVIVCTATPDTWMPITAARLVGELGAIRAGAFDLNAACSGFVTGLSVADAFLRSGTYKKILLIGSDVFSTITDWSDRTTCVLFGDGAGAVVLESFESQNSATESQILGSVLKSEFDRNMNLAVLGGGSLHPHRDLKGHKPYITMNGGEVFKSGTRAMAAVATELLEKLNFPVEKVDWLIPHQANRRIIEMVGKLLNFPLEKTYVNVDRWGNTSAGTVAICLAEMNQQGLLKKGQNVLLVAFGGGFTAGATLLRW